MHCAFEHVYGKHCEQQIVATINIIIVNITIICYLAFQFIWVPAFTLTHKLPNVTHLLRFTFIVPSTQTMNQHVFGLFKPPIKKKKTRKKRRN